MSQVKFDGEDFKKKATEKVAAAVTKRLKAIRCRVHGQNAKVVARTSGSKLVWDISGCCDQLVKEVKAALK